MTYKVEYISEPALETRCNELAAEGWILFSVGPHKFDTEGGYPVYLTVWSRV